MNLKRNITIVADCDEVLTNISPLWTLLLHKNRDYFGKYFDLPENFDINKNYFDVLLRKEFYLNKNYLKKDLNLSAEEEKELFERFMSLYDNEKFYDYCKPTKIALALADLCRTNYINKIYIVSRTTEKTYEGKKKFLERLFKGATNKIEFISVPMNGKKSDVINTLGNIDVFIDDELKNVYDVIENTNSNYPMDIFIPKLGYNYPKDGMLELSIKNNKNISYYNIV